VRENVPQEKQRTQGRRGAQLAPAAPCALVESTPVLTTGGGGSSGVSCALVLTAYFVLL
jgi:hypothetical protein